MYKTMKKYLFLVICFAVLGISQVKAQAAKVALQHDGNVTLFNADELQKALDASVDGDILYLNEGTFNGGVTISKKVSVIGAGENTVINGNISISVNGILSKPILESLTVTDVISTFGNSKGLTLKMCTLFDFNPQSNVEDVTIDRCYQKAQSGRTGAIHLNNYIKNMNVINSKVSCTYGIPSNVSNVVFTNCNIYYSSSTYKTLATFINLVLLA